MDALSLVNHGSNYYINPALIGGVLFFMDIFKPKQLLVNLINKGYIL